MAKPSGLSFQGRPWRESLLLLLLLMRTRSIEAVELFTSTTPSSTAMSMFLVMSAETALEGSVGNMNCTFENCSTCLSGARRDDLLVDILGDDGNFYPSPLRIAMTSSAWNSATITQYIAGILASEMLGLKVEYTECADEIECFMAINNCADWMNTNCDTLLQIGATGGKGYGTLKMYPDDLPDVMLAVELSDGLKKSSYNGTALHKAWSQKSGSEIGPIGYVAQDGLFVWQDSADLAWDEQKLDLTTYRAYTGQVPNLTNYFNTPDRLLADGVLPVVSGCGEPGDDISDNQKLRMDQMRQLGWTCLDSWWLTPACAAFGDAWTSNCLVLINDDWGYWKPKLMESLPASGQRFAMITVGYDYWLEIVQRKIYNASFTWYVPDDSFTSQSPVRISQPYGSEATVEVMHKVAWQGILDANSDLRSLLTALTITSDQMQDLMSQAAAAMADNYTVYTVGNNFFQKLACDWVQANKLTWLEWMPVPQNCSPGERYSQEMQMCMACPAGRQSAASSSSSSALCSPCELGFFAPEAGMEKCARCPAGSFTNQTGRSVCHSCPPSFSTGYLGAMSQSECTCLPGTALVASGTGQGLCVACGEGLICKGGTAPPVQQGGYFARYPDARRLESALVASPTIHSLPSQILYCKGPSTCPEGLAIGTCPANRIGLACDMCKPGYVALSHDNCIPCSASRDFVPPFVLAIVTLLSLFFIVIAGTKEAAAPSTALLTVALTCTVTLTTVQSLAAFARLNITWVEPMLTLKTILNYIVLGSDLIRPGCMFRSDSPVVSFGLTLLAHPVYASCLAAGFGIARLAGRRVRMFQVYNAQGVAVMVLFLSLAIAVVDPFLCQRNPDGTQSMVNSHSILCWTTPEHMSMVGLSVVGILVYLCSIPALVLWATWRYPAAVVREGGINFLRCFQWLFGRFTEKCYFYGGLYLLRNLLIALIPVLLKFQPLVEVACMNLALLVSGMLQARWFPWRTDLVNHLELVFSLAANLILLSGTMLVGVKEKDEIVVQALLSFAMTFSITAAVVLILWMLVGYCRQNKDYGIFLSHHKDAAGTLARWAKMELEQLVKDRVFLDSDDLRQLDLLGDIVANKTRNLLILLTQDTLRRPWCAAEVANAVRGGVHIVLVGCEPDVGITDDLIAKIPELWTPAQMTALAAAGVEIEHVVTAYKAIRHLPILPLRRNFPEAMQRQFLVQAVDQCKGLNKTAEFKMLLKQAQSNTVKLSGLTNEGKEAVMTKSMTQHGHYGDRNPDILILVDNENKEAQCAAFVMRKLLQTALLCGVQCVSQMPQDWEDQLESATGLVVLLTQGILDQTENAAFLVAAAKMEQLQMFPVLVGSSFSFPSEDYWTKFKNGRILRMHSDMLSHTTKLGKRMTPKQLSHKVALIYQELFKTLAGRFTPHGSARIQQTEIDEILPRLEQATMARRKIARESGTGTSTKLLGQNPTSSSGLGDQWNSDEWDSKDCASSRKMTLSHLAKLSPEAQAAALESFRGSEWEDQEDTTSLNDVLEPSGPVTGEDPANETSDDAPEQEEQLGSALTDFDEVDDEDALALSPVDSMLIQSFSQSDEGNSLNKALGRSVHFQNYATREDL